LAQLFATMPLSQRTAELERMTGEYQKQTELVAKLQAEHDAIGRSATQQKADMGGLATNVQTYQAALKDWRTLGVQATGKAILAVFGGADVISETKVMGELLRQFQQLSQMGSKTFGLEQYKALEEYAKAALEMPSFTAWDKDFIKNQMTYAKDLADQAEAIKRVQVRPGGQPRDAEADLEKARQEAERLKGIIDQLTPPASQVDDAAKEAQSALGAIPDMSGLAANIQAAATAMWNLAAASQNVQPPSVQMTAHSGGVAWKFLAGGGPVGTDVIPAMLSPGEVVINAASARRFAGQLTAINAGVEPVYRNEGGSVTNIGDINVTVSGGGTTRQTARSIAAELRRELRRGTATL
jgi:hypothetical protein